jgi:hypothetical protein
MDDLTWLIGTPSRSETTCAKVVSWPWPWLCEPVSTSMVPTGLTRISPIPTGRRRRRALPTAFDGAMPQASM